MNIKDLKPVSAFAKRFGVKMVIHGPPGSGKTPLIATAPRPLILLAEKGAGSLRGIDHIPGYQVDTSAQVDEFFLWWFGSSESKAFDTLAIDSISHIAEMYLATAKAKPKHAKFLPGAYGEMSDEVMVHLEKLNNQQEKHLALIAKMGWTDDNGVQTRVPIFPGKDLNSKVPHLFDNIAFLDRVMIPGHGERPAVRNHPIIGIRARDRFGKLAELEPPNLSDIFAKSMA